MKESLSMLLESYGAMAALDRQVGHGQEDLWKLQLQPDLEQVSAAIGTRQFSLVLS